MSRSHAAGRGAKGAYAFVLLVLVAGGLTAWLLLRPEDRPLPGRLAFVRAGPGTVMVGAEQVLLADPRLVVARASGGAVRTLVEGGFMAGPAWSPDGTRLAFSWAPAVGPGPLRYALFVVEADGGEPVPLTACRPPACERDVQPAWSPEGARIAFVRSTGRGQGLHLLELTSGEVTEIPTPGLTVFSAPSWAPDGRRLVFAAYPAKGSRPPEVYVVNADGTGLRRLTTCTAPCRGGYAEPAWSPDGTTIAMVRGWAGRGDLFLASPDGSSLRRLTSTAGLGGAKDSAPTWSPDGAWIAFVRGGDFGGHLFAIRADGTGLRQLTFGPRLDAVPAWGPA